MKQIFGHADAMSTLKDVFQSGRIHHAWIFSGPSGVGKCTLAEQFASVILDPKRSIDLLGTSHCTGSNEENLMSSGTHPDLHIIRRTLAAHSSISALRERKQMNIPLDLLRELIMGGRTSDGKIHESAAYHTASLSEGKVFIIDEADRMDIPGQNAMLKTLEEPPSSTYFILVTDRPERLIPTIWSRCQHIALSPLGDDEMKLWLDHTDFDLSSGPLQNVIDFSEGSPGMATRYIEHDVDSWCSTMRPIMDGLDCGAWTASASEIMVDLIDNWAQIVLEKNSKSSKNAASQEGAEMVFRIMTRHLREKVRSANDPVVLSAGCDLIDRVAEAESQILSGLNLKHILDALTSEWASQSVSL